MTAVVLAPVRQELEPEPKAYISDPELAVVSMLPGQQDGKRDQIEKVSTSYLFFTNIVGSILHRQFTGRPSALYRTLL